MNYSWDGEPIADIHEWAREHTEQMVRVRKTWREPLPLTGQFVDREEILEMPAVFFSGLRFGGMYDVQHTELERFDP